MKRLLFYSFITTFITFGYACQSKKGNGEATQQNTEASTSVIDSTLVMTGSPSVISSASDTIKVSIINNTSQEATTGEYFTIEEYKDNDWKAIPLELMFIDIAYILQPGEAKDFNISLHPEMHKYEAGKYRVKKSASTEKERYDLSFEFELK